MSDLQGKTAGGNGEGFAALLILAFLHASTIGILFYFPRFVVSLGGSSTLAGGLALLGLLPLLPGPWTRWAERQSPLFLIAWGLVLSSLSRWGIAQTDSLSPMLVFWALLVGLGFSWCFIPMLRLAHDIAPLARRGRAIAWFVSVMQLGNAAGSFAGGLWVASGQYSIMFGAATLILLLAVIPLMRLQAPVQAAAMPAVTAASQLSWRENLRVGLPYMLVMLAVGMAFGLPLQFMPVHIGELASKENVLLSPAAFLSTTFLAILASRILLAHALDGRWRTLLYWVALLVLGVALFCLGEVRSNGTLTAVAIAYGLGYSLLFPVVTAQGLAHAPPEGRAAMSSNLTLGFEVGTRGAALPAGMIADTLGFSALFMTVAVIVLLAAGLWGWKAMRS